MKQDWLPYYRQRLEQERVREGEMLDRVQAELEGDSDQESISELSVYDNHPADIGTETFERSKDIGLRDRGQLRLAKINEALTRIDEGTYGTCRHCGAGIPEERLDAVPEAVLCKACQEAVDARDKDRVRPVEEQVVSMPFGGIPGVDDSTGNAYDGEDSWGDVARYGTSSDTVRHSEGQHLHDSDDDVEEMPYRRDEDGIIYQDRRGRDDESPPA
jgi:YteA family regulatory protein